MAENQGTLMSCQHPQVMCQLQQQEPYQPWNGTCAKLEAWQRSSAGGLPPDGSP